jgi:beta-phosphoglucomutase
VEDAAAGVASIKDAGMRAVGVGDPQVLARADYIIASMREFRLADYG